MKHLLLTSILSASALCCTAQQHDVQAKYVPTPENIEARSHFADQKFGVFLHWGLYSLFAQGEWYMQNDDIDRAEYAKAMDAFYPHRFDAARWVSAIKAAGARYICFTTRHHEGFSMWDTKLSDYNIMHTPYGRDIVRQLVDECHRQGVGIHLYYSHIDWTRDDYPTGRTGLHTGKDPKKANWKSYYNFMNGQLTELLTQYGKIDGIWFDGWWDHDEDATPFDWQLPEQYALIHKLQPACIIGNNHHQTPFDGEDMQMFERDVPGENKSGLSGQDISRLPLETCQTMNGMWGYKVKDQNYKSTTELIRLLVRTASKGANLLLNVGPQPNGELPATTLSRFEDIGKWLGSKAAESIYSTQAGTVHQGDSIVSTASKDGRTLYVHLLTQTPQTSVTLPLQQKVKHVESLLDGKKLRYTIDRKAATMTITVPDMKVGDVDYIIKVEK